MKVIGLLLVVFLLSGCGIEQVDEGHRGIKTVWGKVDGDPLSPGLYFYNPVSSNIFEMSVREEKYEGETEAFTKDTQSVTVNYAVTVYPDSIKIGHVYSQFGKDWADKLVIPAIKSSMKDAIGQFVADDLVGKRESVREYAFKEIKESLSGRDLVVTRFDITNLNFKDEYEKAVEAKVVAIQRAAEAKNRTIQIEEEAKQKVKMAMADAEAMRIKTQALTQSKSLVSYEAVQKWDGALPKIMLGGQSMPILDLKKIMSEE